MYEGLKEKDYLNRGISIVPTSLCLKPLERDNSINKLYESNMKNDKPSLVSHEEQGQCTRQRPYLR